MRTIHKYPLQATDDQEVALPSGAQILHVAVQHRILCLWALVEDGNAKSALLRVYVRGTGHNCTGMLMTEHLGTVFMDIDVHSGGNIAHVPGGLVWHVFGEWVRT